MTNLDVIQQLDSLAAEAGLLRNALEKSEQLPALRTATALVKLAKLTADLGKLSAAARKTLAPLYGREPDGDGRADGDKRPRPKK